MGGIWWPATQRNDHRRRGRSMGAVAKTGSGALYGKRLTPALGGYHVFYR